MTAELANNVAANPPETVLSGTPFYHSTVPSGENLDVRHALAGLGAPTDLSACLLPLLEAVGWRGNPRQVAEVLPHFVVSFDITSFRNILATLGYQSVSVDTTTKDIKPHMLPCLFLAEGRDALVLPEQEGETLVAFDSASGGYVELPTKPWKGTAYVFAPLREDDLPTHVQGVEWFRVIAERFRGMAYQTLAITFLLNVLALATPLFVMAVYDRAIAGGSATEFDYLAIGVGIAVFSDFILRIIRSGIFSFVGARLGNLVGVEVFRKIVFLPTTLIERSTVGAQVGNIMDSEAVSEFFTGPAAPVILELPFVLIFVAVTAYLGGPVAFVPIIVLTLLCALGLFFMPKISEARNRASKADREKQELAIETLGGVRAVKYCGAETTWLGRYRRLSARAALEGFYTSQISSLLETLSYALMVVSGFATVLFGVTRVQAGDMTLGALVACLILVWRAQAPLQTLLTSLTPLSRVESSVQKLNELMKLRTGRGRSPAFGSGREVEGQVTFSDVSFRYDAKSTPAIDNADFDVKSGRILAVVGSNGAGKSTLFKLLTGMYKPDTGAIRIDNRDIGGMTRAELRDAVAYVPQTAQFFYGTIAQNLRLAHPTATDDELRRAAKQAGALEDIEALEQGSGKWKRTGFNVRLGDRGAGQVSPGLLQRLNLARGYLKQAPILLLDEPGNGLDAKGDQALMRTLANLRGKTTVFIITHRPSHLKMADRILWMEYGSVRSEGRPKEVMEKTRGML